MLGSVGRVGRVGRTRDAASVVAPVGKTYADYVAFINGLGYPTVSWSSLNPSGNRRVTCAAATGELYGSPEGSTFWGPGSTTARIVQHAFPSQAVFNDQVANGRLVVIGTNPLGIDIGSGETIFGQNRNGFASQNRDGPLFDLMTCDSIIWWDDTAKKAFYRNSRQSTAPAEMPF